jgi:hypothetical protein
MQHRPDGSELGMNARIRHGSSSMVPAAWSFDINRDGNAKQDSDLVLLEDGAGIDETLNRAGNDRNRLEMVGKLGTTR